MNIKSDDLNRVLEREKSEGALSPLWIIVGEEPLLALEAGDALRSAAKELNYSERVVLAFSSVSDWSGLIDAATSVSLFDDKKIAIPAEDFESYGTIRFINEFPLIIRALLQGATLIMDEFDASIHPMALMSIINIFHNDEININHAQLIFNTHNPIFLDASLFRRDEIKFVERNKATNRSIHYALSDFKTANGVRKGEDYMKNYFVSRYGAIEEVDFSSILKEIIHENEVKNNG